MGKVQDQILAPGQWLFSLDSSATYVHVVHPDVDDVVGRGTIDIQHDQHLALSDTRLSLAVGLPHGLALSLMVPLRVVSTTIRYEDASGMPVELVDPGVHHRNETLDGPGDPDLLASFGRRGLTVRAGLSLPLGETQPNPYVLGAMDLPHEHIQLGTGTIDPIVAIEAIRPLGRWRVGGFALTQQSLYHDGYGYRAGARYAAGLSLARGHFDGGVIVQAEGAESWTQTPDPEDGNRGRVDVLLDAGASLPIGHDVALDVDLKLPVYDHAVGGQIDMPAIVGVGASWSFGRSRPPVAAPVQGRITIVDYWASWCVPCHQLEPKLIALVRRHPEATLKVIDESDSDTFTEHLPRIAVYDASGGKLWERSADGDVAGLYDDVAAALGEKTTAVATTRVEIAVTELGFEPGDVAVPVGVPVTLVFTRKTDQTCATSVAIPVGAETVRADLPLGKPIELVVTFPTRGTVTYVCGMNMLRGQIEVR